MTYEEIARMAFAFVIEDEIWPAFVRWVVSEANSEQALKWGEHPPSIHEMREMWCKTSDDPIIKKFNYRAYIQASERTIRGEPC